jgi:hypothetical protein
MFSDNSSRCGHVLEGRDTEGMLLPHPFDPASPPEVTGANP